MEKHKAFYLNMNYKKSSFTLLKYISYSLKFSITCYSLSDTLSVIYFNIYYTFYISQEKYLRVIHAENIP